MVGDLAKAEAELEVLGQTCLIPCDEYGDLERAIAIYRTRVGSASDERIIERDKW